MAFATDSNLIIDFAWIIGILCSLASMAMILFVIWFRGYVESSDRRKKLVNERWQERLFDIVSSDEMPSASRDGNDHFAGDSSILNNEKDFDDNALDNISKEDSPYFLYTWNYIHESLRGNAKERLNAFAIKHGIQEKALKMLKSRLIKHRLLALNTLGNLADKDTYDRVAKFVSKKDPIVSVWAFRAMFRIRPRETMEKYLYMIAERDDWSPAHVAKILKERDPDMISMNLVKLCGKYRNKEISEKQYAYMVSYLRFAHQRDAAPLIEKLIFETSRMEVLISCLRLVSSPSTLTGIRNLLNDDRWQLRMFSIMALERFGQPEDIDALKKMLRDETWWVRYYAAQALLAMPTMTTQKIRGLSDTLGEGFERDILLQVLAEDEFRCRNQSFTAL